MLLSFQFFFIFSFHLGSGSSFSVNFFCKFSICLSLSLSHILCVPSFSFSRRSISLSCVWKISSRSSSCLHCRFATVAPSLSDLFVKVLLDCLSLPAAAPASAVVSEGLLFAGPFLRAVDATHFLLPPSPSFYCLTYVSSHSSLFVRFILVLLFLNSVDSSPSVASEEYSLAGPCPRAVGVTDLLSILFPFDFLSFASFLSSLLVTFIPVLPSV